MSQIKLVAGLGNPGDEYSFTRHNCGFLTIDAIADELGVSYWKDQDGCKVGIAKVGSGELILAKPQAFMNKSGGPLSHLMKRHGVKVAELLVVHDDLELSAGTIKLKVGGGHAGHNGLRSISNAVGQGYARVRVGIGRPPGKMSPADYVLAPIRKKQTDEFRVTIQDAADAAIAAVRDGIDAASSSYGG